ncbi:MAG: polysaccharide ABC transporter ATP-binding protein [Candidatus Omnitrophota bacterium]
MSTVIKVENLGKRYVISHQEQQRYRTLRDVVTNKFKSFGKKTASTKEEIWALKNVSFEVKQGERVGIIGRNGAGKSTLLKLLSRITEPTKGKIGLCGRVGSLLEVGTGFHPELTGRENIYLNGAILGMSKSDIRKKFDDIVAFAEIDKFLDTPVKRYSSGMYVRLAFAVAAHLEPEILLVDEVLAVGDVSFQKKCLGKMEDVSQEGRTLLFVSHDLVAVRKLCKRTILLCDGKIEKDGFTDSAIDAYLNYSRNATEGLYCWNEPAGRQKVWPVQLEILDESMNRISNIPFDSAVTIALRIKVYEAFSFQVSLRITNNLAIPIFSTEPSQELMFYNRGYYNFSLKLPFALLSPGYYRVALGIHDPGTEVFFFEEQILSWQVIETGTNMAKYKKYHETGVIIVDIPWEIIYNKQDGKIEPC